MDMFCNQCQEALKNTGCTMQGICGKKDTTSNLQDLLIYVLQGISVNAENVENLDEKYGVFVAKALFATITNANFDDKRILELIKTGIDLRDELAEKVENKSEHDSANFNLSLSNLDAVNEKSKNVGILSLSKNEDIRSLKSLVLFGMKGIAAYADHAEVLGYKNEAIARFLIKALASLTKDLDVDVMKILVLQTGEITVSAMALLDKANTEKYGNPEITKVNIGVRNNPAILISGHDLKDMEELLKQTDGTGVDVYTHSEMLPANYYPAFKQYKHFVGNYGNAWWKQGEEFEKFNGPILMTTNCITPVKDAYKNRIFTTGMAGYPAVKHIADRKDGASKDFSEIIELAKKCPAPQQIEEGEIIGGFAHHQVLALADKIVDAVKSGAIKRFVVMAGCDGRHPSRNYFTDVAQNLPQDTVILTAGCAKYRYNKLKLGDIGGIPRVLDAGQCNDSYSLAVIALKLKEVFKLDDINDLPLSFDIAWYEQKAVAVLLALLYLGVKKIHLGPTLPAFLSPNVTKILVELFEIQPTKNYQDDIKLMLAGK
jgi:hydroxylamine reductase